MTTLPRGGLDARLKHAYSCQSCQCLKRYGDFLETFKIDPEFPYDSVMIISCCFLSFPRTELGLYLFFVTENEDAHVFRDTQQNYRLVFLFFLPIELMEKCNIRGKDF